jgi:hypothetical protein
MRSAKRIETSCSCADLVIFKCVSSVIKRDEPYAKPLNLSPNDWTTVGGELGLEERGRKLSCDLWLTIRDSDGAPNVTSLNEIWFIDSMGNCYSNVRRKVSRKCDERRRRQNRWKRMPQNVILAPLRCDIQVNWAGKWFAPWPWHHPFTLLSSRLRQPSSSSAPFTCGNVGFDSCAKRFCSLTDRQGRQESYYWVMITPRGGSLARSTFSSPNGRKSTCDTLGDISYRLRKLHLRTPDYALQSIWILCCITSAMRKQTRSHLERQWGEAQSMLRIKFNEVEESILMSKWLEVWNDARKILSTS